MQHVIKLISNKGLFRILLAATSVAAIGCASTSAEKINPHSKKVISNLSNQKIFYKPYEIVWRAAQLSLKYPIAVNNMDNGLIETESIKAIDGFRPPHQQEDPSTGIQYKINMTLVKGKVEGQESVRVTINKILERKRDFFTEPEALVSDGFEETVILYRMERELVIDDAIKKAAQKGQL